MRAIICGLSVTVGSSIGLMAPATAVCAPITFYGQDPLAGPADPRTNADAAAASFDALLGSSSLITFEGLPVGSFGTLEVLSGVTVTLTNMDVAAGISNIDEHVSDALGYNVTPGGQNHLRVVPPFASFLGGTVTYSFASPIDAFGAYLTDTDSPLPGPITVTFFDGTHRVLSVPKPAVGGASFFGLTDFGAAISSVSFHTGPTGLLRDVWGMDDVRFRTAGAVPVPELGTMLLVGVGMLAFVMLTRKRAS
ncbi:MAG: hypothetical protein ACRD2X_12765 [Vicinamibacteraceae bacterium]